MTVYFSENFNGTGRLIDRPSDSGHVYSNAYEADQMILSGSGSVSVSQGYWAYVSTSPYWTTPGASTTEIVFNVTRPVDTSVYQDGFELNVWHHDRITAYVDSDGFIGIWSRLVDFYVELPVAVGEYRVVVSNGPNGEAWATVNGVLYEGSSGASPYASPYYSFDLYDYRRSFEPVMPPIITLDKIEVRSYEPLAPTTKFWTNEVLAVEVI